MTVRSGYEGWTAKEAKFERHCQAVGHGSRPALRKHRGRWKCEQCIRNIEEYEKKRAGR